MSKVDWIAEAETAMDRDPRYFRIGYLTGGSFVMDSVRVFVWFQTIDDLVEHIVEAEPRLYNLESEDLAALQEKLRESLADVSKEGLDEETRNNVSAIGSSADAFVIDWWGTFDELINGSSAVSADVMDSYTDGGKTSLSDVSESELDEFVDYLKTCYV